MPIMPIQIIGNDFDNLLNGTPQEDIIFGNGGNDTLNGLASNDTLDGGEGSDIYVVDIGDIIVETGTNPLDIDTVQSSIDYTIASLLSIENLALTGNSAVTGTGNNNNNRINGNNINNLLQGLGGNDTLNGLAGADTLDGGNGNDSLLGFTGTDSLLGGAGNDTLRGGNDNDTLRGGADNDLLFGDSGNDNLVGDAGNDTLRGGDGNDTLNGQALVPAADHLEGQSGDDLYLVDHVNDVIIEAIGGGTDSVTSRISFSLPNQEVENLNLGNSATAINGTGNSFNNRINGNNFDNTLRGLNGNDTLRGVNGHDSLEGGLGDDSLEGGSGNDTLIGGPGNDALIGGTGQDHYVFDSLVGIDRVQFISGDQLVLNKSTFAGLNSTGDIGFVGTDGDVDNNDKPIVYSLGTGTIFHNPDLLTQAGNTTAFATFDFNPVLSSTDFIVI